jgi:hypothetical protein
VFVRPFVDGRVLRLSIDEAELPPRCDLLCLGVPIEDSVGLGGNNPVLPSPNYWNQPLPDQSNTTTCHDIYRLPVMDSNVTCTLLQDKYARYCGCYENATADMIPPASCTLCKNSKDAIINVTSHRPAMMPSMSSCRDYEWIFSVQTSSMCQTLQEDLIANHQSVNLQAYCDCPDTSIPNLCGPLCPEGFVIPPDQTNQIVVTNNREEGDPEWALVLLASRLISTLKLTSYLPRQFACNKK